jgi:Holliday junction resolvasome RuvABC endonuclease subunit
VGAEWVRWGVAAGLPVERYCGPVPTVVGLDLSLRSTGVAIEGEAFALACNATGMARLAWIREMLLARIMETNNPVVCVEGYSFGSRNSQAHAAGELGGVVRLALWEAGVPYVDVPPTCRAKFATGKGNASKAEVVSAVSARTGLVWSGKGADDCCDAWILREMGQVQLGYGEYNWPVTHRAALEKVDWAPFAGV